jgi:hypothetical protein
MNWDRAFEVSFKFRMRAIRLDSEPLPAKVKFFTDYAAAIEPYTHGDCFRAAHYRELRMVLLQAVKSHQEALDKETARERHCSQAASGTPQTKGRSVGSIGRGSTARPVR